MKETSRSVAEKIVQTAREDIAKSALDVGGRCMYSPASALTSGSGFYFLGMNPRESPVAEQEHSKCSITNDLDRLATGEAQTHAYLDECWKSKGVPGEEKVQRRGRCLFRILAGGGETEGDELLRRTPTSNFVLRRSVNETSLTRESNMSLAALIRLYWPFHQVVMNAANTSVILAHSIRCARELAHDLALGEGTEYASGVGGTLGACRVWRLGVHRTLIAIPNLSRYPMNKSVQDALATIFNEHVPSGMRLNCACRGESRRLPRVGTSSTVQRIGCNSAARGSRDLSR